MTLSGWYAERWVFSLILLLSAGSATTLQAQELNCKVTVNAQRVQTTERRIFTDMENAFTQFFNGRKWTNDVFKPEERINCNIIINMEEMPSVGNFKAAVQVLSARPVYNSGYETLVFNFADRDWQFDYTESQPLQFNENAFTSNITSMLAYYAYIILGMDYDTYSKMGGTPYFEKAFLVVNNAQQSGAVGWDQFGNNRNRYWLTENLMNAAMIPLREAAYEYHLQGLDLFQEKPDESRTAILQTLKKVQQVKAARPNSIYPISFMDAKLDELVNIYSQGDMSVRRQAYDILTKLDPGENDKLQAIIKN
jgi:hypothetical protein